MQQAKHTGYLAIFSSKMLTMCYHKVNVSGILKRTLTGKRALISSARRDCTIPVNPRHATQDMVG